MNPKRLSQRERALTIYFSSAQEKETFAAVAKELDLTASALGSLCLRRGLETGIIEQLRDVMPGEKLSISSNSVVKSGKHQKSRHSPKRKSAKTETTRK